MRFTQLLKDEVFEISVLTQLLLCSGAGLGSPWKLGLLTDIDKVGSKGTQHPLCLGATGPATLLLPTTHSSSPSLPHHLSIPHLNWLPEFTDSWAESG